MKNLLGKAVKYRVHGNRVEIGFVASIEKGIANIRFWQLPRYKAQYHLPVSEITELSQKEAIKLGREMEKRNL